jgi:hypothetical protein
VTNDGAVLVDAAAEGIGLAYVGLSPFETRCEQR